MYYNLTSKQSFEKDLDMCSGHALFGFIRVNSSTPGQMEAVKETSIYYKDSISIFIIEDDYRFFADKFEFSGSPVFILFKQGK